MNEHQQKELVDKIISGSSRAFRTFIEEYKNLVAHIVFRMIDNIEDREDMCQNIFIKIYQNLHTFKFESKISTWVAKIVYNSCINYLEKKKVPLFEDIAAENTTIDSLAGTVDMPDSLIETGETHHLLQTEIDKLPVKYRTILTLYHLDEMSYLEIGEIMGWPEGTVKNYLFRARKYLKEKLVAKYQVEDLYQ
ncbi:sigma-70 family RNA polymerase sigma factor [candidate division KSB1 bacterium]|nr:sigma-70 family RNA polymerase sigma factor [candidate division KSB1 bacterium]